GRVFSQRAEAPVGRVRASRASRASRAESSVMRSGVAPTTAIGISHAVDAGSGARAVPLRSALLGVVVAVAALAGALTFAVNLSDLVHTPRLYGQAWDV